ncbi:MAG: flagellin [Clostridium sp.]|uniref:flagellin n=1 Tax=Clostridium sp. TaxID=1506 RepID=UPI003F318557
MRLSTNLNSLNIYRNTKINEPKNAEALKRLSSGKKLLYAKDNPNKIGQTSELRMKIKSLEVAEKNLQDTNSMLQATDGALGEINNLLERMKELTVKGVSDSNNEADKEIIQQEIQSIKEGIGEIVEGSKFNGKSLIGDKGVLDNESPQYIKAMAGATSDDIIEIPKYNLSLDKIIDKNGVSLEEIDITDKENRDKYITTVDTAIDFVSNLRGTYGAIQSRCEGSSEYITGVNLTNEKALSSLEDSDIAIEMVEYTKTDLLRNASMNLMAQSNKLPKEILSILERIK